MVRVFVTGDNHVGKKYASHAAAAVLSARRIEAFETMVTTANREGCGLFVVTGDAFEKTDVARRDVASVAQALSAFDGVVAVLPGNHDYYDKDAPVWRYFTEAIAAYDNVVVLSEERPYAFSVGDEQVVLYPAPCTSKHSVENALGWIKACAIPEDGAYHLGVAHGAIEGMALDKEGVYYLMTTAELEAIPVDAWLVGHMHVPFPRDLTEEMTACGRLFNAGTHVQTDVACNTEGQAFILEIANGKAVRAKKCVPSTLRFYRRTVQLTAGEMEAQLTRAVADCGDDSVVDLVLTGAVTSEEYAARDSILRRVLARFTEGTYNDHALSRFISEALIDAEFPETSFSAGLLKALMDEPKEAQLAYELLTALKGGK